jgi:hypothetical protein
MVSKRSKLRRRRMVVFLGQYRKNIRCEEKVVVRCVWLATKRKMATGSIKIKGLKVILA